jgi:sir2 silent information regulator family NAD-dependent deacetylase
MKIKNIMKNYCDKKDGYRETIKKGLATAGNFGKVVSGQKGTIEEQTEMLKNEIKNADAIVVGAGAGLSTSAGLTYSGERFEKYFFDFAEKYGINDMYSGGFYPFPDNETRWAWWARHIYFNRYVEPPVPVYRKLLSLLEDKNYFVITTNVDHQFQRAGFDKNRLFYTQGDYGLFQSVDPKVKKTYDNEQWVMDAMAAQGFVKDENGVFDLPANGKILMQIPTNLIPKCLDKNSAVTMNLRADNSFVEDEGWHKASENYYEFLQANKDGHILFLELGVGANTPVIIKYPFWQMTMDNKKAVYACINYGEAFCPKEIEDRSICINGDIGQI